MIQTLFLNKEAVFQHGNASIHTAGTVQLWFEEHEAELQCITWQSRSPDLNNTEPPWSVLETRLRNRIPPPISLKQVHSKKECGYTEGKRWSNAILLKTRVKYL
jgi:predicted RNA-binding protein with PUA-like domain